MDGSTRPPLKRGLEANTTAAAEQRFHLISRNSSEPSTTARHRKKGPRTQGLTRTKALCWSVGFQNGCWPNGGFSTQSSSGSEFSPGGHFSTHNHLTQRTSELQHFQHKSSNKIWARLSARQGGGPKRRRRVPKRSQQSAGI